MVKNLIMRHNLCVLDKIYNQDQEVMPSPYEAAYQKIRSQELPPADEDFYLQYVPTFLTTLSELHTPESQALLERCFEYCIDGGINQPRQFTLPTGEVLDVSGTPILNRNAFTHHLKQFVDAGKNVNFKDLDLKDLRASDRARDQVGNSAADVLLNQVGGSINEELPYIKQLIQAANPNADIVVCRYGGDEFYFGFVGVPEKLRDFAYQKIKERITSVSGYYGRGKLENVAINPLSTNIRVPEVPMEQEIFRYYFDRMILPPSQTKIIVETLGEAYIKQEFTEWKPTEDEKSDPKYIKSLEFELRQMSKAYPELADMISGVARMQVADDASRARLLWEFIDFFDNQVSDKLLGRRVASISEFSQVMETSAFSKIMIFDFPIKETNSSLSYAHGDEGIVNMYDQVYRVFLKHNIAPAQAMFSRRGATVLCGIRDELPQEVYDDLLALNQVEIDFGVQSYKYSFGASELDLPRNEPFGPKEVRMYINDAMLLAREDWYKDRFVEHWDTPKLFAESDIDLAAHLPPDNPDVYFRKYFYGNMARRKERISFAVSQLQSLIDNPPANITETNKSEFVKSMTEIKENFLKYLE